MSDFENQYNSPETVAVPEQKQASGNLTETMLSHLRSASPWLRFMGILGFIGSGFIILTGLLFAVFSGTLVYDIFGAAADAPVWLASLVYFTAGAVAFFPAFFTFKFGLYIRKFQYSNTDDDLEQAFRNNKLLWKFNGILAIISLSLVPVILIVTFILALTTTGIF